MKKKKNLFRALVCALCMLLCTPVIAQEKTHSVPELLEPVGVALDTAVAYIGEIADITVYDGAVRPYVEELFFELNGNVGEVHAVVGQKVKASDVLVTLDQEAEEERMEQLRKNIEKQKTIAAYDEKLAEIELMMLNVELEQLMSTGSDANTIKLKEIDIEEEKINQAFEKELRRMDLEMLEEELAKMEIESAGRVLTAPFDGVIMYGEMLEKGSYVSAHSPVIYLADDTRLSVQSEYLSPNYSRFAHDIYALIGGKRYEITPIEMDQQEFVSMALSGEKLTTEYSIDHPDESLAAGQYAAVCVVNKYKGDALLVPTNALYHDAAGRYVYVVDGDERVRTPVKTGMTTDWLAEITEGIEEGAVVYVKE